MPVCCFLVAVALNFCARGCRTETRPEPAGKLPHIVLIVADDLGYGDLGCYGATKIHTPVIDQLAEEGTRFTDAYASSSLCSPSRYSILTGRYSWRTRLKYGVLKYFETPLIEKDRLTVASLLKRNGYHTVCIGKWHLGLEWALNEKAPPDAAETVFNSWSLESQDFIDFSKPVHGGPVEHGFDYFFGMAGSNNMIPYVYIENDSVTQPPSEAQKPYDHYDAAPKAPNWDISTVNRVLTEKAVGAVHDHFRKSGDSPLFLYFPASAIHRPCLPTFTKGRSEAGLRGDIVAELDWSVNQIIQALKEHGAYENTVLIFTSDNGPRPGDPAHWTRIYQQGGYDEYVLDAFDEYQPEFVNEQGNMIWKEGWLTYGHKASGELLGFKSDSWEGGFRVPLIIRWPGKADPGTVNRVRICLSDLLATFAEMTGDSLEQDEGGDSYSFYKNILDPSAPQVRTSIVLTGGASGAFVCISEGWKYIEAAEPGHWPETYYPGGPSKFDEQLYHLALDEAEQDNRIEEEPGRTGILKKTIDKVRTTTKIESR
jgi:arylsulfatase A